MESKLLVVIGLTTLCFVLGGVLRNKQPRLVSPLRDWLSNLALLVFMPFVLTSSLWKLGRLDASLLMLPGLGLVVIFSGVAAAVACYLYFKLDPPQLAALVPSTSFYNLGALGTLFAQTMFGEEGVAILALVKLFEESIYFGVIFPFCRSQSSLVISNTSSALSRYMLIFPPASIMLGLVLGLYDVPRPAFFTSAGEWITPLMGLLLVLCAGLTFHIEGSSKWITVALTSALLRVFIGCGAITAIFYGFDLWNLVGGVLYPLCILVACMPSGFIGVIPARIYALDTALSNTSWLATYMMFAIIAVVYMLVAR